MKFTKRILGATFITLAALVSTPALAKKPTSEQIADVTEFMGDRGMSPSHNKADGGSIFYKQIDAGQSAKSVFSLTAGRIYLLAGVCDDDCDNIHLKVYDPDGKVVASDLDDYSDRPILKTLTYVNATTTGNYTVEVTMDQCSTSWCHARVASYRYNESH